MKKCNKCGLEKPFSDFSTDNSKKDKLQGKCKVCNKAEVLKHIKTNNYQHQKVWNNKNNKLYFREWKENNKEYWNEYQKHRRVEDPYYSLYINLRSRISNLLTGKTKSKRTQEIIGLPLDEFKIYLEKQWIEGMNWGNYGCGEGKWVIDHKTPIASAVSENDIINLNHYTNLQPMWWKDNLIKSAKII